MDDGLNALWIKLFLFKKLPLQFRQHEQAPSGRELRDPVSTAVGH